MDKSNYDTHHSHSNLVYFHDAKYSYSNQDLVNDCPSLGKFYDRYFPISQVICLQ